MWTIGRYYVLRAVLTPGPEMRFRSIGPGKEDTMATSSWYNVKSMVFLLGTILGLWKVFFREIRLDMYPIYGNRLKKDLNIYLCNFQNIDALNILAYNFEQNWRQAKSWS